MFDFLFSFIIIVFTIILNFFFTFFTCVFFLEEGRGGAGRGGAGRGAFIGTPSFSDYLFRLCTCLVTDANKFLRICADN